MTTPGAEHAAIIGVTYPNFFIVGVGRSGTTLTRAIVTGHPQIEVPAETGFLPTLWRMRGLWWSRSGVRVPFFVRLTFANGRLSRAGVKPEQLVDAMRDNPPAGPIEAVSRVYELFAVPNETTSVGDKTPGYIHHLAPLSRMLAHARFIHVVRHPLNVVSSLVRQPWGPSDPIAAGWLWLRGVRAAARAKLPTGRLLTMRLEDLVAAPDASVKQIATHLGVAVHPAMFQFQERAHRISLQNVHPMAHRGLAGDLAPTRDWTAELSDPDAAILWSLVGPTASAFGYDGPAEGRSTISEAEAAARLRLFDASRSWRRVRTVARIVRP